MVQTRKYALLFERNALKKIRKIDGFKDIPQADKKKFVSTLWDALNKRADEVYEILHEEVKATPKEEREKIIIKGKPILPYYGDEGEKRERGPPKEKIPFDYNKRELDYLDEIIFNNRDKIDKAKKQIEGMIKYLRTQPMRMPERQRMAKIVKKYKDILKSKSTRKPRQGKIKIEKYGKGITPAERMAMTKAPEKKKDESMKIPPSEIPKNVRRALDALSMYQGIGTALALGGKVLPFLFL